MGDLVRSQPWKRSGTKIYYNGGNVGTGTTTPNLGGASSNFRVLTIAGQTTGSGGIIELANSANTASAGQNLGYIQGYNGTTLVSTIQMQNAGTDSGVLIFGTAPVGGGNTERMRIISTGNVGIGTSSIGTYRLKIAEAGGSTGTFLSQDNTSAAATNNKVVFDHLLLSSAQARVFFRLQTTSNTITDATRNSLVEFQTNNAGTFGTAMAINGGNVGMGTTSPVSKLDVSVTGGSTPANGGVLTLSRDDVGVASGDTIGKLQFWNNDTQLTTQKIYADIEVIAAQAISTDAAAAHMIFRTTSTIAGGSPVERIRITSGGDVGIATSSPLGLLDVAGGAANGALVMGADVNATTRTAGTRKIGRFTFPNFTDAGVAPNVFLLGGDANGTNNIVDFGGTAGGSPYAATLIRFYTASTIATTGGTVAMQINGTQNVSIGMTPGSTNRFQVRDATGNPQVRFDYDSSNGLTLTAASNGAMTYDANGTGASHNFSDPVNVTGKLFTSSELEVDGDLNHDGSNIGFFGVAPTTRQTELTDELTTITHTAPGTPDYAVQDLTSTGGFGFVTADEGNTVLSVIANLQTRVNELETKLTAYGLLQDAD